MEIRGCIFNKYGTIDCEINHPTYGWIPFTASPYDTDEIGLSIYETAMLMEPLPYAGDALEKVEVPQSISRFQARAALMDAGLLADVELALQQAGPLTQLAWAEAIEWRRDSPTIAEIGEALSLKEEDIDNLFIAAAQIKA